MPRPQQDPVAAVRALDREIASEQEFDHDRALTHYRGLLGRIEDERRKDDTQAKS